MTRREAQAAVERISAARRKAVDALGTRVAAVKWLDTEIPSLGFRKPSEVAAESQEGLERVLHILHCIDYGLPA